MIYLIIISMGMKTRGSGAKRYDALRAWGLEGKAKQKKRTRFFRVRFSKQKQKTSADELHQILKHLI